MVAAAATTGSKDIMYTPQMENPIEGTPLDPKRRMFISGAQPGQMADRMGAAGDLGNGLSSSDESGDGAGASVGNGATDHPMQAHGDYEPALSANTPTPAPVAGPTPPPQGGGNMDEDALFQRIMNSTMDDTPSQNRIGHLEGRLKGMTRPKTLKEKLLSVGTMAAPVVAGGLLGGVEGAGGAASGVNSAEEMLHERGREDELLLRKEIESERGRQEKQYERRSQLPLTYMNMKMTRDYRQATVDANRYRTDKQHSDKLTSMGVDAEGNEIPEAQLAPTVKSRVLTQRAHAALYDAQSQYAEAREELARAQNDPTSAVYKLAKMKLDAAAASMSAAQKRSDAMMLSAQTREAQYYKSTFGTDIHGDVLPGTFADPNTNKPMGWSAPGNPVANTKQRGQTAATVLHHFDDAPNDPNPAMRKGLTTVLNETSDKDLGMLAGHFNEWWTGKWGADNPALSQLRTKLMLTSSAMELSHVGQSGGIEMLSHFKSMMNLGQSRGNLLANAAEMKGWLKGYADAGTPNTPAGEGNQNFVPLSTEGGGGKAAPARSKLAKPSQGTVKWKKGPDGVPRPE